MKNSASEIFCLNHQAAYQQVYNRQYVHAIDFWSLLLARGSETQGSSVGAKNSDLQPLIYPLVQVATGAIKYITLITRYLYTHVRIPLRLLPHPRSYPL